MNPAALMYQSSIPGHLVLNPFTLIGLIRPVLDPIALSLVVLEVTKIDLRGVMDGMAGLDQDTKAFILISHMSACIKLACILSSTAASVDKHTSTMSRPSYPLSIVQIFRAGINSIAIPIISTVPFIKARVSFIHQGVCLSIIVI